MNNQKKRSFAPDFIRFFAMFFVFFYHFNMEVSSFGDASSFSIVDFGKNIEFGQLGTGLFFILSGLLLAKGFSKLEKIQMKDIGIFYKKRFLSIMPMYWIAYLLFALFFVLPNGLPTQRIIFSFLGLDGYLLAHGIQTYYVMGEWFTGVILVFYLLFPFLFILKKKAPIVFITLTVLIKVVSTILVIVTPLIERGVLFYLFEFMLGMYLSDTLKRIPHPVGIGALVLTILLLFVKLPFDYRIRLSIVTVLTFFAFFYLGSLLDAVNKKPVQTIKKVVQKISLYSLPVFFTHHVIIRTLLVPLSGGTIGMKRYLLYLLLAILFTGILSIILDESTKGILQILNKKKEK